MWTVPAGFDSVFEPVTETVIWVVAPGAIDAGETKLIAVAEGTLVCVKTGTTAISEFMGISI